jgi:hypothetical protein
MLDREIAERAKELARAKAARRHSADDADAYGADGILKDGHSIRISMTDAKPMPLQRMGTVPMNIVTGLRLDKEFYPDGTPKPPRTPSTRNQVADADPYSANKPGFRTADAARGAMDAGQPAKDSAYSEMCQALERAWMPDHLRAADTRRTTADAARPAGVSDAEWAREQGIRQMSDAWRQDAAAVSTPPAGAYAPVGLGANEGDVVTWNGAPARLVKRGDWLFPVVHQQGATRSGTSAGDAVPRTMDAATAQKIKDAAWLEMVERLNNEWRT